VLELWKEGSQKVQLSQTVEEGEKKEKKEKKKNDRKRKDKRRVRLDDSEASSSDSD
jgi:hypothetical protein